nr:hypothetical protein GCM10020093_013960 [Planobispora longispora]
MGENRRPGLTRQIIVDAALRLLDEAGLEGLTVRRLAAELGVQSPALYWHFRTKQELLNGMAGVIVLSAGMGPRVKANPGRTGWTAGPAPTGGRSWPTATAPGSSPPPPTWAPRWSGASTRRWRRCSPAVSRPCWRCARSPR